jgi:hypothetical protein
MYLTSGNVLGKPQVPVQITLADWAKFLGSSSATPPLPYAGQALVATDAIYGEAEFVLAFGVAGLLVGDAVRIGGNYATKRAVAGDRGRIGISMCANTDPTALSWFCIRGQVPAIANAAIAANGPLNLTAGVGALDDAAVAGDGLSGAAAASATTATVTTKIGEVVNGSPIVKLSDLGGLYVGMGLSGTGIPGATTITAIGMGGNMLGAAGPQAFTIQMSANGTATGSPTITFAHLVTFFTAMLAHPFANGVL